MSTNKFFPKVTLWCEHRVEFRKSALLDCDAEYLDPQKLVDTLFKDTGFQDYLAAREDRAVKGGGEASVHVLDEASDLVLSAIVEVEQYHDAVEGDAFVLTITGVTAPYHMNLKDYCKVSLR